MKKYKAETPICTIGKIRKILSDIGILLLEQHLYLKGKDKKKYSYYYACLDYLKFQHTSSSPEHIIEVLYGHEMATEIVGDLRDRNDIFQYYRFPNCPNCEKCKLKNECKQKIIAQINERINQSSVLLNQQQVQFDIENNQE